MVRRRHGWQLPAHTFQVVAITVFFLLGVAFYTFLAPFLWFQFLEFAALGLYSPLAFAVFVLYIRSSAIDPADVGVFQPQSRNVEKISFSEGSAGMTPGDGLLHPSPGLSTASRSSSVRRSDKRGPYIEQSGVAQNTHKIQTLLGACCAISCGWIVKDDSCKSESSLQRPLAEEEVLFCTLCNAEVRKFSKHCRSCDKCVDGFDHHCRWLNNCVGRKNYNTFVSLMATSLSLLVLEWGIGMAVFVRCFVDKKGVEHQIVDKLGNGFSRGPFATVVAVCTLVSLLASVPLGELFFFHLILIRKGITTYEYVVAMRAQNEQQGFSVEGDAQSFPVSPSSSTGTGLSGSSSVGLQYNRGGWCTPPRIFVDHQEEVLPHLVAGQIPSTIDPDAGNMASRYSNRQKKSAIRISAWKLAKLNTDDAIRAAAKAREASSTLRQLEHSELGLGEGDYTSSTNISSASSVSGDYSYRKERLKNHSSMAVDSVQYPSTYTVRDDSSVQHETFETGYQSRSSGGSPVHTLSIHTSLSPLPAESRHMLPFSTKGHRVLPTLPGDSMEAIQEGVMSDSFFRGDLPGRHVSRSSADFLRVWSGPAAYSDGYDASSGESVDDGDYPSRNRLPSRETVVPDHTALSGEGSKGNLSRNRLSEAHGIGTGDGTRGTSNPINYVPTYRFHWLAPSASPQSMSHDRPGSDHVLQSLSPSQRSLTDASSLQSPSGTSGNLVYTGTSIFYGGPMSQTPVMVEGEKQALPPKPPVQTKTRVANPSLAPELKLPVRGALRSQSPVFAPRTILPLSLLGSPRK